MLKEYYQTVTRRLKPGMSFEDARADVRDLQTWKPLELTSATFEQAWLIEDRMQISWWDALIVAAACQTGCTFLISEDLQSGQTINNLTIIDPFTTTVNEP